MLVQSARGIETHVDDLALLNLVDADFVHAFDLAGTIGDRRRAQSTRVEILDLVKAILQHVNRLEFICRGGEHRQPQCLGLDHGFE